MAQPAEKPAGGAASLLLGQLQAGGRVPAATTRIAIVGLPVLDRAPSPLMASLAAFLADHMDWRIVFTSEAFADAFKILHRMDCHGILARVVTKEIAAIARRLPCPLVNVSTLLEDTGLPTVRRDDRGIGRMCARHLLDKRFTRVGIVEIPFADWCYAETEAGFLETIRAASPAVLLSRFRLEEVPPSHGDLARFREWLATLERPHALFVCDDLPAPELMDACRTAGFSIPWDFAFIAGGGHADVLPRCHPALTHPAPDGAWLIRPACEMLAGLIKDPALPVRTIIVECPGLVTGISTDVIAVDDPAVHRAVDFMDSHFRERINVADVVAHCGRSRRIMELRFSEQMQTTMHAYLAERRIRYAIELMEATPAFKITQVANACGFSNWKAMTRTFRSVKGESLANWRKDRKSLAADLTPNPKLEGAS